jgi:hypothetical protein
MSYFSDALIRKMNNEIQTGDIVVCTAFYLALNGPGLIQGKLYLVKDVLYTDDAVILVKVHGINAWFDINCFELYKIPGETVNPDLCKYFMKRKG